MSSAVDENLAFQFDGNRAGHYTFSYEREDLGGGEDVDGFGSLLVLEGVP